ncbi:hypothetical protein ACLBXM_17440 [Xanthobacteraceae bacterium A53D]
MTEIDLSRLPQPLRVIQERPKEKRDLLSILKDVGLFSLILTAISALAVGTITGFFQYTRWYVDQRQERARVEFTAADKTFREISADLARMQALQEILFFLYKDAADTPPPDKAAFLSARGRDTFTLYEKGRVDLRAKMDSYIFEARRALDWPSRTGTPDLLQTNGVDSDPLSYGKIAQSAKPGGDFSCASEKTMPQSRDHKTFNPSPFKEFRIDWQSSTHHLIIFNYCFRALHTMLEPARVWAADDFPSNGAPRPVPPLADDKQAHDKAEEMIVKLLNNQVHRLNGFSALGITQVERTRKNNEIAPVEEFVFGHWLTSP